MAFEVVGRLHRKFDTENKTDTFQAREFILEVQDGNYPQLIKFQLVQDRCTLLDGFNEDEQVKVFFDLRGREWNGKFFTNLNAWKLEKPGETASPPMQAGDTSFPGVDDEPADAGGMDDLPF